MLIKIIHTVSQFAKKRSLKNLIILGGFWGAYGQLAIISGPIFAGYALWLGLGEADIALMAAISSLACIIQPFSFLFVRKVINKKRFIIGFGIFEITFMVSVLTVPAFTAVAGIRLLLVAIFVLSATLMSHLVSPLFNSWFSAMLPADARSRFLGSRLIAVNLSAMAAGYIAGEFIDRVGGRYVAFLVPYIVAWITGVGGYLLLIKIPFPQHLHDKRDTLPFVKVLTAPFSHSSFRLLLIFYLTWAFAALMSDPFFNVFMIKDLHVTYSTIAIYNIIFLACGILGYRFWGNMGERYGSKPVLQILMIPRMLFPLAWIFLTSQNFHFFLPILMVFTGFVFAGLTVAINTLLFGTVPNNANSSVFFASWAFASSLITFLSSGIGSVLARILTPVEIHLWGFMFNNLRIIFAISSLFFIIPLLLVRRVTEIKAKSVAHLLGQVIRGNSLSFAFNAFRFSWIKEARRRARAIRAMGRSKSPMAIEHLVQAMNDVNPEVREQAVKGLGDTGAEDAVPHLIEKLVDDESDIQVEAAVSLGKLKYRRGIEALFSALDSKDNRVVISAVRALGDISGEEVKNRLYEKLKSSTNKLLLPTLIESLSRLEDIRAVLPALEAINLYQSPVIRFQLLNATCRALGAENLFYELFSKDELTLAEHLYRIGRQIGKQLRKIPLDKESLDDLNEMLTMLMEGKYNQMPGKALEIAGAVAKSLRRGMSPIRKRSIRKDAAKIEPAKKDPSGPDLDRSSSICYEGTEALRLYIQFLQQGKAERPELFSIVCLKQIIQQTMKKKPKGL